MRTLVLGGYGFLGLEIAHRLAAAGHQITCIARSAKSGRRVFPRGSWIAADIAELTSPDDWRAHLSEIDAVVNASGALQSGLKDNLEGIHHTAIAALISACEASGVRRFVQISAVGARANATTEFLRSKSRGDACITSSSLDWVLLRPGLVLGANAYGGTALLRAVASVPLVQPLVYGDRLVQTVAMSDLVEVVLDAVEERLPAKTEFDLVEDQPHTLRELVESLRDWLGVGSSRVSFAVPEALVRLTARVADGLGCLGWRSPIRSTTLTVLAENVVGNSEMFKAISDRRISSLRETLARMPATLQDKWFARLYLLMPLLVAVLSIFWLLSGIIALSRLESAAGLTGLSPNIGRAAVLVGAVADMALGMAILYRPLARAACWGMVLLSLAYVILGSLLRPDLWLDPLGPLLKVLPVTTLALVAVVLLDDRR